MSAQRQADESTTETGSEVAVFSDDPFIAMVERLATNKDVDPDKLEKLVNIQMSILDRNAEAEFNQAMSRVQSKLPTVLHDAFNQQTKSGYAKLKTISKAIKPIYTAEGFSTSFTQAKSDVEGWIRVEGVLRHSGGHSVSGYYVDLPPDDAGIQGTKNKTPVHAAGSTLSYGRRYCTCLMFDIATEDDNDGNGPPSPPPVRYISEKQVGTITDLLTQYGDLGGVADDETFCNWAKIESVDKMPANKFASTVKNLKERIEKQEAKNA